MQVEKLLEHRKGKNCSKAIKKSIADKQLKK